MTDEPYYVYILTDEQNSWLYTGYTKDLKQRVGQHKRHRGGQFTRKYNVHKLVYFEIQESQLSAIHREIEIKKKGKPTKIKMISEINPDWRDLYDEL
jgi:putative endonuclease